MVLAKFFIFIIFNFLNYKKNKSQKIWCPNGTTPLTVTGQIIAVPVLVSLFQLRTNERFA